ncbi:MAG: hypothetical protein ACOCUT_02120, partial [bacterium]
MPNKKTIRTKMILVILILFITLLFSTEMVDFQVAQQENHLMFLRKTFQIEENKAIGYVIYADTKGGEFVHAAAPGEGITCVDDTARAGIYFLRRYTEYVNTNNEKANMYQTLVLETIEFCQHFRTIEGDYYNFLFEDGKINKNGITSRPSKSWWALRALWLISEAINVFSEEKFDASYHYQQALGTALLFKSELDSDGLIRGYTDLSSLYVICLSNLYNYSKDSQLEEIIEEVTDGIISKQTNVLFQNIIDEGRDDFNFHSWGSRQIQALTMAFEITKKEEYYQAACDMANNLYPHMINMGPLYAYNRTNITIFPQIAYGIEAAVSSLYYLYLVEKEEKYAIMMALLHGFFYGNNHLNREMIGENGEGFDGLESVFINRNAGAESTISFLLSKSLVDRIPEKFAKLAIIDVLKKSTPVLLKIENMNYGLSNVEDRVEEGVPGLAGSSFKLRDMIDITPGRYKVFLFGKRLYDGTCSIALTDSKTSAETKKSESPFHIGTITKNENESETTIIFTAKFEQEAFLSQLFFLPTIEYQIFSEPGSQSKKIWIFNSDEKETAEFKLFGLNEKIAPLSFIFSDIVIDIEKMETTKEQSYTPEKLISDDGQIIMLNLSEIYNNNGIGTPLSPANFDNFGGSKGAYYPENVLKNKLKNGIFNTDDSVSFSVSFQEKEDNIIANGQIIEINEKGQFLYILGSCDHGIFSGELEITYNDGEKLITEYAQLTFLDWCDSGANKENIALELPYRYTSQDLKEWINP